MKDSFIIEIVVATLLAVLLGILTYAHSTWMPSMATMTTLVLIVVAFATFAVFVWRENHGDEREQLIRYIASRVAFLATGSVLLLGIIVETFTHYTPNPWLGLALIVMVGGKIIGHTYGRKKY